MYLRSDSERNNREDVLPTESTTGVAVGSKINNDSSWWNSMSRNIFVQFCNETSLAGLKYVGQRDRHVVER